MLELKNAVKTYKSLSGKKTAALDGVSFSVNDGESVAIVGRSGAGKSTLLNVLAGIDRPDSGELFINGKSINTVSVSSLAEYRNRNIGFIIQSFGLIDDLTVLENVLLPLKYRKRVGSAAEKKAKAIALLDSVGMDGFGDKFPPELSGGECQRVAIARALMTDPPVILADEPTGSLDGENEDAILAIFAGLRARGTSVVIVTHDDNVAKSCDRIVTMRKGKIVQNEEEAAV